MSILKFVNDKNRSSDELKTILNYCSRNNTLYSDRIYGNGLLKSDIYRQMRIAKKLFHQEEGKQYQHLVISNDHNVRDVALVHENAVQIAQYFDNYQCVAYTHTDTDNLHTHLVINTVNMCNGKKLILYKKDFNAFIKYANKIFKKNGLNPIHGGNFLQWNREDFRINLVEYDTDYDDLNDEILGEDEEYDVSDIKMLSRQFDMISGIKRALYFNDEEEELRDILRHMERVNSNTYSKGGEKC